MRTLEREDIRGTATGAATRAAAAAPVRPVVPAPRRAATARPATRRAPVVPAAGRPEIGCAGPVAPASDEGYRMGRGARLTVTLSVVATALVLLLGWAGPGGTGTPPGTVTQTVQQDESLLQLAAAGGSADSASVAERLAAIRELNGWQAFPADAVVPAGTSVLLPAG